MKPITHPVLLLLICLIANAASPSIADEGDPVAIRLWPDGGVTVETMWNLHVGAGLTETTKKELPRAVDLDLKTLNEPNKTLRRLPNEPTPTILSVDASEQQKNDVTVSIEQSMLPNAGKGSAIIAVDGVKIYLLGSTDFDVTEQIKAAPGTTFDVIIANSSSHDQAVLSKIASVLKPRYVIVNSSISVIGDQDVTAIPHNTLAISAVADDENTVTRFVSLTDKPYGMSDELAELFSKKEAACKTSRETFAKLSIEQMNFQPSNGTHTPRWNSEHMMGRELLFFSQIYHAVDPRIPVMDLNPRQMPDDYEMAHADWTGQEEARQTERVEAFTRRFAYLLDGMDLDQKAKGSKFWTPLALLKQMERHYNEHTANVDKKMQLNEWPNR